MTKTLLLSLIATMAVSNTSFADKGRAANSVEARYAYTMGYQIGEMLKNQGLSGSEISYFMEGVEDRFDGDKPRLDKIEMKEATQSFQELQEMKSKNNPQQNTTSASEFLNKNKSKEGVVSLPSGLQYQVLGAANGEQPKATDTVMVHYQGSLVNGKVFDSSIKRGKPAMFPLQQVIPGFREAITRMKTGEKWRVFMPPELAYGEKGVKGVIGPNQVLIFEIELLSIN